MENLIFTFYKGMLEAKPQEPSLSLLQRRLQWGFEDEVAECQIRMNSSCVDSSEEATGKFP